MDQVQWDEASSRWLLVTADGTFLLPSEWSGTLAFEGEVHTDEMVRRVFAPDGLSWKLPKPMRITMSDVGGHDEAQAVGTIATAVRGDGGAIDASGTFDLGSAIGREAARLVALSVKTGVSVDTAPRIVEYRVSAEMFEAATSDEEFVDDGPEEVDGQVVLERISQSEQPIEVHVESNLRGATLVDIPAFEDARITAELVPVDALTAATVQAGGTTVDVTPTERMVEQAETALRWLDDGTVDQGEADRVPVEAVELAGRIIGDELSADDVRAMSASFDEVAEEWPRLPGFDPADPGFPVAERVIMSLWGGQPGREWADDKWREIVNAEADADNPPPTDDGPVTAAAVPPHETGLSTATGWDGDAAENNLLADEDPSYYRTFYAWSSDDPDDDGRAKEHHRFGHHEVDPDGVVGDANEVACRTGIAVLNGARGGTTIPREDYDGVYNHLANHLRSAGLDAPDQKFSHSTGEAMTASTTFAPGGIIESSGTSTNLVPGEVVTPIGEALTITGDHATPVVDHGADEAVEPEIVEVGDHVEEEDVVAAHASCGCGDVLTADAGASAPPADWFTDPGFDGPTPLTVTADGRVFGHLALFGTCHVGMAGTCVTPPRSMTDYAHFRTGAVLTDDGSTVAVGHLTFGGGHAEADASPMATVKHYDDAGTAVADVVAGEDAIGIWVAGRVRPGTPDNFVEGLRAHALSGDWRRIGGNLELVAALSVNVPGFPVPRVGLTASGEQVSLVAAIGRPRVLTTEEIVDRNIERRVVEIVGRRERTAAAKAKLDVFAKAEREARINRARARLERAGR